MVMEFWTEDQEWPIYLPQEPPRDRVLVARRANGSEAARWYWNHLDEEWVGFGAPETFYDIAASCGSSGWTLYSLPAAVPADQTKEYRDDVRGR